MLYFSDINMSDETQIPTIRELDYYAQSSERGKSSLRRSSLFVIILGFVFVKQTAFQLRKLRLCKLYIRDTDDQNRRESKC